MGCRERDATNFCLQLGRLACVQVDDNVTRHVDAELAAPDWDVLILHYLGLDHIGHLAGPLSPLVPPKLREMDDVVRRIYEATREQVGGGRVRSVGGGRLGVGV